MENSRGGPLLARAPTQADVARIARSLNEHGVKYAVIGGFAMIHHGFVRATMDIDLLVAPDPGNIQRLREALSILEDKAVLQIAPDDVQKYTVVRVADEMPLARLRCASGNDRVRRFSSLRPWPTVPLPRATPLGARDLARETP